MITSKVVQPQTDVAPILFPQTPLPVPQVPILGLVEPSFWVLLFELDEVDLSLFCSVAPKPYGEVVLLFKG